MTGHGMEWWATVLLWLALHPWVPAMVVVIGVVAVFVRRKLRSEGNGTP